MPTGGQKRKKGKQNSSTSAKMTTPIGQSTNINDDAAGWLSDTDLHHIVMAAMEGRHKQQFPYSALANNYTSLICSFDVKIHAEKENIASSIFMQKTHEHLKKDTKNPISLT